jgi:hypothetical protein
MRPPAFFFTAVLLLGVFVSPVSSQGRFQYPEAHFSFDLPAEWERIPDEVVRDYHNRMLKKTGAAARVPDLAFHRKSVTSPFDLPYFLVNLFEQDVDESIIREYLSSIKNLPRGEMGDAGRSARGPIITGPSFDGKKKRIKLSIDSVIKDGSKEIEISGYFAIFFFKDGVVAFNFYAGREQLSEYVPVFDRIIDSAVFEKGYEYKPPLFGGTLARISAIAAGALIVLAFVFWRVRVRRKKKAVAGEPAKGQHE